MSEALTVPASGTVHWVGAGLSTGSGLGAVRDTADRLLLWNRTPARAEERLEQLGLTRQVGVRSFTPQALADELRPGDIVVSMLPATSHPELLRVSVRRRAHFACSSYVSADMEAQAGPAAAAGLTVLAECGLDPGIDHLLAHRLVGQALRHTGPHDAEVDFTSYCGGIPAVTNDFTYRFSWAPLGVLNALRAPSQYIRDGVVTRTEWPWEATEQEAVGTETFEVYPNRDSVPFIAQYGLPANWRPRTFVRGTLRLNGWRTAWAPVFDTLRSGDDEGVARLAQRLAAEYPTTPADRDRVVLAVALSVRTAGAHGQSRPGPGPSGPGPGGPGPDGAAWSGGYVLDATGSGRESAMARCVSLTLACGVTQLLRGGMAPGLHRAAASPESADRWLGYLAEHGIVCRPRADGS
jgi:hypothetical protein